MNGCDSHMAAAEPGCANCFHRLMGRYDAQKSESLQNHHAWCSVEVLLKDREEKLAAANLQIDELKLDLKESGADADALILLSKGLYERVQGKPDWVVASSCQTALNYIDYVSGLNGEMRLALEIAKPSTIHVLSGHVYGPDDKLAEFVDGCARCRIERILQQIEKRSDPVKKNWDCNCLQLDCRHAMRKLEEPDKRAEPSPIIEEVCPVCWHKPCNCVDLQS